MSELLSSAGNLKSPGPKGDERLTHGMSVDVEDWFQVWALSSKISRDDWDGFALRVGDSTTRLLDLFAEHDAKSTFFVLGWVAERLPQMVKRMAADGHEIASHGYEHVKVFDHNENEFRADVSKTKAILEDLSGKPVTGYRAAGFSMDSRTPFAHTVLAETGHAYSSSSHPISHDHYGDPDAPMNAYRTAAGIIEIPVAVRTIAGRRQSCAGGGWFRAMPYSLSRTMWKGLEKEGRNGIFYFHPWEIDPEQPRINGLPIKARIRHRLNLGQMEGKIARLLTDFRWGRIDEVFAGAISDAAPLSK